MRFIVSSTALLRNLQLVGGIISSNVVVPVLEDFHFVLNNSKLTITGGDMETMISVQMDVQIEDTTGENQGKICIPAKILLEYLKNLPEQPVHFQLNQGDRTIDITSNSGKYKIGGDATDTYPKEPEENETVQFTIPSDVLIRSINKTLFAVSTDNLRQAMTGVLFEFNSGDITFVSTDAHRLIKISQSGIDVQHEGSIIVPRKPLQQLKNILPNDETPIVLSYNPSHLFLKYENVKLSCRLIDGKFPPYRAVIPVENPFNLVINRANLISSLKRVSIFSNKSTGQVAFDIVGNNVTISAQDIDFSFEGNEQLPCQYNGEDMKIAFNSKLLLEIIDNLDGEDVLLELSQPSRAGIYRSTEKKENEDLLMLIMPLIVNV